MVFFQESIFKQGQLNKKQTMSYNNIFVGFKWANHICSISRAGVECTLFTYELLKYTYDTSPTLSQLFNKVFVLSKN